MEVSSACFLCDFGDLLGDFDLDIFEQCSDLFVPLFNGDCCGVELFLNDLEIRRYVCHSTGDLLHVFCDVI